MTPERARILATYARDRRGWDEAGSMKQLAKVKHLDDDRTALAWVRFCADAKVATPGAFPNTNGPHWSERINPASDEPRRPRPEEACRACGRHNDRCICEVVGPVWRPDAPGDVTRGAAMARELLRKTKSGEDA